MRLTWIIDEVGKSSVKISTRSLSRGISRTHINSSYKLSTKEIYSEEPGSYVEPVKPTKKNSIFKSLLDCSLNFSGTTSSVWKDHSVLSVARFLWSANKSKK
eukprot:Lithocolla_globosa_v1_NODE_59_length_7384_cov_30.397053.p4 type:complete len:102 gc:universal NODE_59_length_7384_cov_30.397053:1122-1427(+)